MQLITAVAVAENKRNASDTYRVGLKPANGGEVVVDVCNRAFWVVDTATPINERMLYLGEGIIAQGYQYTVSVTTLEALVGNLNIDLLFDQRG